MKPIAVIFKSLANCTASVVGADLDRITPTPILAALIKISEEIRPLNISTLFLTEICLCIQYPYSLSSAL